MADLIQMISDSVDGFSLVLDMADLIQIIGDSVDDFQTLCLEDVRQ
jgi:hypothetical protein